GGLDRRSVSGSRVLGQGHGGADRSRPRRHPEARPASGLRPYGRQSRPVRLRGRPDAAALLGAGAAAGGSSMTKDAALATPELMQRLLSRRALEDDPGLGSHLIERSRERSEERRVGKEWRARWATDQ